MYYTIYKITNKINGKFYIGSHKTKDLDDNYMGSGKYLKCAQVKHGLENFEREILFVFNNPQDMYEKEAEIVNEDFIAEQNTYNIKLGGFGGWDYVNDKIDATTRLKKNQIGRINADKTLIERYNINNPSQLPHVKEKLKKSSTNRYYNEYSPWKEKGKTAFSGKHHTDESKLKIGQANAKNIGELNSQFGTCWIMHELIGCKKCKKDLLPEYIDQGWIKGRKYN